MELCDPFDPAELTGPDTESRFALSPRQLANVDGVRLPDHRHIDGEYTCLADPGYVFEEWLIGLLEASGTKYLTLPLVSTPAPAQYAPRPPG